MATTSNYLADLNGKEISVNGSVVSPRRNELNLIAGTGVSLEGVDNAALNRTDVTITASGISATVDYVASVRAATAVALPAYTRTGNVITASANGTLPAIDGVTLVVGNRLLLQNGASSVDNGVYVVTSVGSGATPFVLTRAADYDASAEVSAGQLIPVEEGTTFADSLRTLATNDPITINGTALTYTGAAGMPPGSEIGQILTWTGSTWLPGRTITKQEVGSGVLAGVILQNPTSAASIGAPQHSPTIVQQGRAMKLSLQREVFSRVQTRSTSDGTTVTPRWVVSLGEVLAGTAADAATLVDELELTPTALDIKDNNFLLTGFVQIGSTVAASGDIRGTSTFALKVINAGTTYALIGAGSGGLVVGDTNAAFVTYRATGGSVHAFEIGGTEKTRISATELRLPNLSAFTSLNAAGNDFIRVAIVDSSNVITYGKSGTSGVGGAPAAVILDCASGGTTQLRVNGVSLLSCNTTNVDIQSDALLRNLSVSNTFVPEHDFFRAKAGTTIVANNDVLGQIVGWGYDGAQYRNTAIIKAVINGTPSSGNMPTAWQFYTGTVATPVLRLQIDATGSFGIFDATTAPSVGIAGRVLMYSEGGAGKAIGGSGTVTTWAPADPHCKRCGRDFALEWKNPKYGHLSVCVWCWSEACERAGIPIHDFSIVKEAA